MVGVLLSVRHTQSNVATGAPRAGQASSGPSVCLCRLGEGVPGLGLRLLVLIGKERSSLVATTWFKLDWGCWQVYTSKMLGCLVCAE